MSYKEDVIKAAEELGWHVDVSKDFDGKFDIFEFAKMSPAGEDFYFTVWVDDISEIIDKIWEYIDSYDISYETYLWLDECGHGVHGAPWDMRDLYNDKEASLRNVEELYEALKVLPVYDYDEDEEE